MFLATHVSVVYGEMITWVVVRKLNFEDRGHLVRLDIEIRLNYFIYIIRRSRGPLLFYQNAHFMHSLVDNDALIVFEIFR